MQKNIALTVGAACAAEIQNDPPEWLRPRAACKRFGVSRSWLYAHIKAGRIKSASVRQRGSVKGIRLISRDSLAAFIEGSIADEKGAAANLS